jgi:hypothetical protein
MTGVLLFPPLSHIIEEVIRVLDDSVGVFGDRPRLDEDSTHLSYGLDHRSGGLEGGMRECRWEGKRGSWLVVLFEAC